MSTRPLDPDHPCVKEPVELCDIAWRRSVALTGLGVWLSLCRFRGLPFNFAILAHSSLEVQRGALRRRREDQRRFEALQSYEAIQKAKEIFDKSAFHLLV